jgi:hypothetical protein
VNCCRRLESDTRQLRAFLKAALTNDTDWFWNDKWAKSVARVKANGRKTLHTWLGFENESCEWVVEHETSFRKNWDGLADTKSWRIALILNKLATVSTKQTIIFNTKVGIVWHWIAGNMIDTERLPGR